VSATAIVCLVVCGAAVTAAWIHVRFPGLAPESLAARALHLGAAVMCLGLAPAAMGLVPDARVEPGAATLALLSVFYPALVYTFVSAIWVARTVQQSLRLG
jgi:hypothetical protein